MSTLFTKFRNGIGENFNMNVITIINEHTAGNTVSTINTVQVEDSAPVTLRLSWNQRQCFTLGDSVQMKMQMCAAQRGMQIKLHLYVVAMQRQRSDQFSCRASLQTKGAPPSRKC